MNWFWLIMNLSNRARDLCDIGNRLSRTDLMQLKVNEEMTIAEKYIEEKRLMQYKGDATCKIKNSLCVMHNIMRTMIILEHWYSNMMMKSADITTLSLHDCEAALIASQQAACVVLSRLIEHLPVWVLTKDIHHWILCKAWGGLLAWRSEHKKLSEANYSTCLLP